MARDKTFIDPKWFYKPVEVKDFTTKYPDDSERVVSVPPDNGLSGWVGTVIPYNNVSPVGGVLGVVSEMNVAEQNVRTKADGTHVVDVVVNITDVPGIGGYNIRINKA